MRLSSAGPGYQVTGPPVNEAEQAAAENLVSGKRSDTRDVEITLFAWPNEKDSGLLAVLQYSLNGANPSMGVLSIGLLAHVVKSAGRWGVKERYLLNTMHHHSNPGIRLLNLTRESSAVLIIESDAGGAGSACISFQVFDLRHGFLEEILNTYSWLEYETEEGYSQKLDVPRTLQSRGAEFCFVKSSRFENGVLFSKPRTSRPCYHRGDGVDPEESRKRNEMLKPLHP